MGEGEKESVLDGRSLGEPGRMRSRVPALCSLEPRVLSGSSLPFDQLSRGFHKTPRSFS